MKNKLGGYQAVDKSRERKRINAFLKGKDFIDLSSSRKVNITKISKGGLKFDKNGMRKK